MRSKTELTHLTLAIFWITMTVPAVLFWKESILLVIMMSLYANIEASLAAFLSAKPKKKRPRLRTTNLSHQGTNRRSLNAY